MSSYLQKCRDLATYFLEDSDVTNADRLTLAKHVEALAEQLNEVCGQYVIDAEREDADRREQITNYHRDKAAGYDV